MVPYVKCIFFSMLIRKLADAADESYSGPKGRRGEFVL